MISEEMESMYSYRYAAGTIRSMRYFPLTMQLIVIFADDSDAYVYENFPEEMWYEMKNDGSMEHYFNRNVAGHFFVSARISLEKYRQRDRKGGFLYSR